MESREIDLGTDFMLVVHPSLPAKSVGELISLARSRPGQINFASVASSPAEFASFINAEIAKWGKVARSGVPLE